MMDGTSAGDYPATPKLLYKQQYFARCKSRYTVLSLLAPCPVKSRFEQEGYNILQELLLNAIKGCNFTSKLNLWLRLQ